MFFLIPGSSGASPGLTGTSLPSEAVPVAFSAWGAMVCLMSYLAIMKSQVMSYSFKILSAGLRCSQDYRQYRTGSKQTSK